MSETIAKSARPANTAIAWAGRDGIYVEFPTKQGTPYVSRFPKTPSGLIDALNLLIENPMPKEVNLTQHAHPAIRRIGAGAKMDASHGLQSAAADAVKKLLRK